MTSERGDEGKQQRQGRKKAETVELSREEIAERAFAIHLKQGAEHGRDLEDWLQAERELREERENGKTATGA